ncbi:hypothetical protein RJT34_23743 [Clitoria ternatea]|uniref:Transcription repressor n=1 Tax=Clitoria ternatea TaxID=43366 RepID=A0AAN9IGU8_CLITE
MQNKLCTPFLLLSLSLSITIKASSLSFLCVPRTTLEKQSTTNQAPAMSSSRKNLVLNTVSVDLGCGSCRRPKLLRHIFSPKPKPKRPTYQKQKAHWAEDDTATSSTTNTSATTFSPCCYVESCEYVRGFGRVGTEGVAVEKDSDDPYLDFRHSMLQMILENEIYSKDDLRELLHCFLQLNSPQHHGVIVRAFTEIWNGVFSRRVPPFGSPKFAKLHILLIQRFITENSVFRFCNA